MGVGMEMYEDKKRTLVPGRAVAEVHERAGRSVLGHKLPLVHNAALRRDKWPDKDVWNVPENQGDVLDTR